MIRVKRQATGSYTFSETAVDDTGATQTVTGPYTATLYDGAGAQIAQPAAPAPPASSAAP